MLFHFPLLLSLLLLVLGGKGVLCAEIRIRSADEFIQFKNNVNNGKNYSGTTVFLDSDLSLVGKSFGPIGNYDYFFRGVFDGQGHVISNLEMTSASQRVGLFGYSEGLTIKNVILDSSCSITSSRNSGHAYIGGIIGVCETENGACTIENSVNMGSVTFSGSISSKDLYLGGIAGALDSYSYNINANNCANYGDVTHSGESSNSYIGGIVGYSYSDSESKSVYIYNCLNHGTITHSGTTSNLRLGGINGYTEYTAFIENCVSGGKISLLTTASENNNVGSIVGEVDPDASINYCYFTSDLSGYEKYGTETPDSESNTLSYDNTSFELSGLFLLGATQAPPSLMPSTLLLIITPSVTTPTGSSTRRTML